MLRVLITGGTGTLGHAVTERFLARGLIVKIFSRDEFKQQKMREIYPKCKFYIGDIRDKERFNTACANVDIIIHAAALKRIDTAYYNPFEMIKTNIIGTQNVIDCALANDIQKVVFVSSDKAVEPINLYGTTKLCAEKMIESANNYKGDHRTKFMFVRYGNVFGARGFVLEAWEKQNPIQVRGKNTTRFHLMINQAVDLIEKALLTGLSVVPAKLLSYNLKDLAVIYSDITGKPIVFTDMPIDEKEHEKLTHSLTSEKAKRLTKLELNQLVKRYLDKAI